MSVANTILSQLGGNKFLAMTGAKQLVNTGKGLQFKIGKNESKANIVSIELNSSDTYTVTFRNLRGINLKTIKEFTGVYDDMLQNIFTSTTGLLVRL